VLTIEIKESSRLTYDEVVRVLSKYDGVFTYLSGQPVRAIEVVMVGWVPPDEDDLAGPSVLRQRHIASYGDTVTTDPTSRVALLSIDYGKTIGRPWRSKGGRARWLAALAAAKRSAGMRRLRAHNVPPDSAIYRALLQHGVDLIGSKELRKSETIFTRMGIQ
jgi:hypothetical protein